MVTQTYAVVDPRAVVVKSFTAPLADATVPGAISAHNFAIGAKQHRIEDLHELHEVDLLWFLQVSWVLAHGERVENYRQGEQCQLAVDQGLLIRVQRPHEKHEADVDEKHEEPHHDRRFQ